MPVQDQISLGKAMWRGFLCKCPACGKGSLFARFLKATDACAACGDEMKHHRADDLPAYLVIVIVGHAIVPGILAWEIYSAPDPWLQMAVWLPLTLFSCLGLLQPVKGSIIGLQWHLGMHGFDDAKQRRMAAAAAVDPAPRTA